MFTSRNLSWVMLAVAVLAIGLAPQASAQDDKTPAATQPATQPAGVTGTWTWSFEGPGGNMDITLKLKQDGEKLTGTITGFRGEEMDIQDGTVKDGAISFKVVREFGGQQMVSTYTGKLSGDTLTGKSETVFSRDFEAKRAQAQPGAGQP